MSAMGVTTCIQYMCKQVISGLELVFVGSVEPAKHLDSYNDVVTQGKRLIYCNTCANVYTSQVNGKVST